MRTTSTILLALLATACEVTLPPPPVLTVTSPNRGLVQSDTGVVTVTGTALPTPNGDAVTKVEVNGVRANLAADGTFSAEVDVSDGATLLQTTAYAETGASVTDARAVHAGHLRPVATPIERAITVALSAEAFTKIAETASNQMKQLDFTSLLAPMNPMANVGDSWANAKMSINKLALADVKIGMTPIDGGLTFAAEIRGLDAKATAAYDGTLVPAGSTTVGITADAITISGTLVVTPNGTSGFSTSIASPTVRTTNLQLEATGVVGTIVDLLNSVLSSTVQKAITAAAEKALQPGLNAAFAALTGPKQIPVLGRMVTLRASPSAVVFTRAGANVTLNLLATIAGGEASKGYIYTPNGMPAMNMVPNGVMVGISDDLLNQMISQVHALGVLDYKLTDDFGVFNGAELEMKMPPMISANTKDGSLRLVLGDMTANFTQNGQTVISAAVNAQVDLTILRGSTAEEVAVQFGEVKLWVNVFNDHGETEELTGETATAASQGIGVQLDSLSEFMVTVPVPSVAGITLDNLALRTDSGYVIASGQIH